MLLHIFEVTDINWFVWLSHDKPQGWLLHEKPQGIVNQA